jgi:NAD(P)-dependent dehydrogenase (short-subunit alcohol dehydrogenase family)
MTQIQDTPRTAIVTGGSRGLGRALTTQLEARGWRVIIDGRHSTSVMAAAGSLKGAVPVPGNIVDPAHRQKLVEAASMSGRLDLLVNNASTLGPTPLPALAEYPLDEMLDVFRVNVLAPVGLVQAALPLLRASHGAILNITSDAAVEPYGGWGGYGSSKAALEQVSRILSVEEPEVRVWWFDPGDMRTQMHQDAFPGEDISDRPEPETVVPAIIDVLKARPPSGRIRIDDLVAGTPR